MINDIAAFLNEKGNVLFSPLSLQLALELLEKGARGNTLSQINRLIRENIGNSLNSNTEFCYIANSLWLNKNINFYMTQQEDLPLYKIKFDGKGMDAINSWVKKNTNGMIDKVIDNISEADFIYLINAVSFEAKWEKIYDADDISYENFTLKDESQKEVTMMLSREHLFLKDQNASGFMKYYKGEKYAFAALLPAEGTYIDDYIKTLSEEKIEQILKNVQYTGVDTAMPKFNFSYEKEFNETLMEMGVKDAFNMHLADFSGFGISPEANIYISSILHKTHIDVCETGTKAEAVTMAGMLGCVPCYEEVILNRPFVFMIIDCKSNIPIFIGKLEEPPKSKEEHYIPDEFEYEN